MKKLLLALSLGLLSACQPNALRSNPTQSGEPAIAIGRVNTGSRNTFLPTRSSGP